MSRCFPFPPPGYELKGGLDDVNLIIKEKHKTKKHKDKKEKKERSERKDKERGEDKSKEDKKRKREKHGDKKDKKKDKPSSSGEKKSEGSLENQNGQKLVPDSELSVKIPDKRAVVELGNRVRNDGATGLHMVQKITIVEKERTNFLGNVQDNGNGVLAIKDTRDHSRTANGLSLQVDSRSLETGRNFVGEKQIKVEEGKERNGYKNIVGEGDGSKNEDQNKNTKAEDKKRKKEKRKEKKEKKERKEKKKELTGSRKDEAKQETSNGSFLDFHSSIPSDLLKENNDCQGKLPKLKELNGFLHAKNSGVRPNNMSRPAVMSPQAAQTESGFRPSQNTTNLGVGKRAVITDQKVNGNLSSPQSVIDNVRNIGPCQTANSTKMENGGVSVNNRVVSNGIISPHIVRIERKMEPKVPSSHPLVEKGGKLAMQTPGALHKTMHKKESEMNGFLDSKNHSSSMPSSTSLERKEKVVIISSSADGRVPFSHPHAENGGKMGMQTPDALHKMMHRKESRMNDCLDTNHHSSSMPSSRMNGSLDTSHHSSSMPSSASLERKEKVVIIKSSADGKVPFSHPHAENGGKIAMQTPDALHDTMHKKESRVNGSLDSKNHSSSMPSSASLIRKEKIIIINSSIDGKVPFSHPLVENGGKMAMQTPDALHKTMHKKESKMNGFLDSKHHSSSMPSSASLKRKEKVVTTMKPPHPDLKYLSQILTVPEVEWPQGNNDQEWLFDRKDSETKRAKLASPEIQCTEEVWSRAIHLSSADVTALPYVIPY